MRALSGRVIDGRVDLGGEIEDGTPVAVLVADREPVRLTVQDEAELSEALAEIHRGEFEDGDALLREIKAEAGS